MKRIVPLLLTLSFLLFSETVNIAVLNFNVNADGDDMDFLSGSINDMIVTNISGKPNINLIERDKINSIVEELNLSASGLVSEHQQIKIGELAGAEFVITGSITFIKPAYMINSRVLEVETGSITSSQSVKGPDKSKIFDSVESISEKIYMDINTSLNDFGNGPKLEVAFIIDTTGSMGDEINVVKSKIISMIDEILQGTPRPIVRFAVVAYRDKGDMYTTKKFDFNSNVKMIKQNINSLTANGGGDFPECVMEALHKAMFELSWSKQDDEIGKLCFLIGDAEAQNYSKGPKESKIIKEALRNSLSISTISCSGNSKKGIRKFQDISNKTNGTFSFLTYTQEVIDQSGKEYFVVTEGDAEMVVDDSDMGELETSAVAEVGDSAGDIFLKERAKKKAERARSETKSKDQATEEVSDFLSTTAGVSKDEARRVKSTSVSKGKKKNNLDKIMSEQIKVLAEKQGVKYDDKKKKKKESDAKKNKKSKKRKILEKILNKSEKDSSKVVEKDKKTETTTKPSRSGGGR